MPPFSIPVVFTGNIWQITDLNADFQAIVDLLNTWNPTGNVGGPGVGAPAVRGAVGINNTGTPNTKYDVSADAVVLRDPATGTIMVKAPLTTVTNDILLAGPVLNGRDQILAFTPSLVAASLSDRQPDQRRPWARS